MGLTSAERQKKYRERLKERLKTDPELKKEMAAKARSRYYREKVSQYIDEEKEKRRQQWREAELKCTSTNKTKVGLTPAEKQKRYRERLKENPDKYEEYRKKAAAKALLYYKEKVSQLTDEEKKQRRQKWRDANRNQTLAKKQMPLTPEGDEVQEKRKIEGQEKHEETIKNMEHSTCYNRTENICQTTQNEAKQQVKRRLTSAERQRRYREKLKKENPEKYEEYKKKSAAKALLYYRKKVSQLTEEEKEQRRQKCRDANRNQTLAKKQMPLTPEGDEVQEKRKIEGQEKHEETIKNMEHSTCYNRTENICQTTQNEAKQQVKRRLTSAERQRRYREKLKKENPDKYEEYKKKSAAKALLYYRKKVSQLTEEEKEQRRQKCRDANRNQTLAKKQMPLTPEGDEVQEKRKIEGQEKHEETIKNMEHSTCYNGTENICQTTQNEAKQQVKRRLTSAERQRRYREKLKKENPEKYEEYKKKSAAKALLYYRKKVSQLTEEEKEKRKQQWTYANQTLAKKQIPLTPHRGKLQEKRKMDDDEKHTEIIKNREHTKCSKGTANISQTTQNEEKKQVKRRLTSAERTRRYREKLKKENPDKYEEYRRENAAKALRYYREKVRQKRQCNGVRGKILSPAERVKRYRERLKRENLAKYEDLLKKSAEASKRYYREKAKLYTEEEKEERRQNWREARKKHKKQSSRRKQKQYAIQINDEDSSSEDAQPGPSERPMTPPWDPHSPSVSDNNQRDPLSKLTDQCRFCGKDSEDCLIVSSHMPYLSGNSTTLALNDISVQLDFDDGLPNTVCIKCNNKLHEFSDFIKSVKGAQETMKRKIKTEPEDVREVDIIVKTEPTDFFEDNSISISDTVFVKKTYKRKADETQHKEKAKFAKNIRIADETKHKEKAKFAKRVMVERENRVVINIKEDIVDEQIESSLSDASSDTLSVADELETTVSSVIGETLVKKEAERDNARVMVPQIVSGMIIRLGPSTSNGPNDEFI